MIQIDKKEIKACCGKKQTMWKLSIPLSKDHLPVLQQAGFYYLRSFYDAGMMYIEDRGLTARGVFGLNELHIRCKNKQCEESVKLLEQVILTNF